MAVAKQREYRALVALSVGRVERFGGQREERAERVERGGIVSLTDAEAANLGRFVRLIDEEESSLIPRKRAPKYEIGLSDVNALGNTEDGALDVTNSTRVYKLTESEADEAAQPTKNPVDASYTGE